MAFTESPLTTVAEWKRKSLELSNQCGDHLFTAVTRGFEAIIVMLTKQSDSMIQKALNDLNFDRIYSLQIDDDKSESLRSLMHGILESLQIIIVEWSHDRNQINRMYQVNGREQILAPEEPEQVFVEPLVSSLHTLMPMKMESQNIRSTIPTDRAPFSSQIDFPMDIKNEADRYENRENGRQDSVNDLIKEENENKQPKEVDEMDNRGRSTRNSYESLDYIDVLGYSDEDAVTPLKKSRSESVTGIENNSIIVEAKSASRRESRYAKINDTEIECPKCEFHTRSADSWISHLRLKHSTTPTLAGVALLCACGFESASKSHTYNCGIANFTVIKKGENINEDGRQDSSVNDFIGEEKDEEEKNRRRSSANNSDSLDYIDVVGDSDSVTPPKKSRSESMTGMDNNINASGVQSVSRRKKRGDQKISDTDMECHECEFRTRSVGSWIDHLRKAHSTTTFLAGLALLCECGAECISASHSYSCDIANFTVIKRGQKATPQCVLCEFYPKTATGYTLHLQRQHKSTLLENGIYLMCACGLAVCSRKYYPNHSKNCDGRQFSIHNRDKSTLRDILKDDSLDSSSNDFIGEDIENEEPLEESSETKVKEKRGRVSRNSKKLSKYADTVYDSDADGTPVKKAKVESTKQIEKTTPQCVLCEKHPRKIYGYPQHLKDLHNSTLIANGIYLICSCGQVVRSNTGNPAHTKNCDGLQYTLHKLGE